MSPRSPQLNQFYYQAGRAALVLGRYEEAPEYARKAVDAHPGWAEGWGLLASAAALSGQDAEARAALAAFDELRPGFTLEQYRRTVDLPSENTAFLAGMERFYEGLSKAGMPDGEPVPAN